VVSHPSQPLIAVRASYDKLLLVELSTGRIRWESKVHPDYRPPMFSERLLAVEVRKSDVLSLVILDIKTGAELHQPWFDKRKAAGLVLSPGGMRGVGQWYGLSQACVRIYGVETGAMTVETSAFPSFGSHHPVDWLPDGKTLVFVAGPNQVRFCDA